MDPTNPDNLKTLLQKFNESFAKVNANLNTIWKEKKTLLETLHPEADSQAYITQLSALDRNNVKERRYVKICNSSFNDFVLQISPYLEQAVTPEEKELIPLFSNMYTYFQRYIKFLEKILSTLITYLEQIEKEGDHLSQALSDAKGGFLHSADLQRSIIELRQIAVEVTGELPIQKEVVSLNAEYAVLAQLEQEVQKQFRKDSNIFYQWYSKIKAESTNPSLQTKFGMFFAVTVTVGTVGLLTSSGVLLVLGMVGTGVGVLAGVAVHKIFSSMENGLLRMLKSTVK
jgi:hypothetical protein